MASINDIAKKVGFSKSTVSKVLSGKGNVSSSTIKKIRKAAKELGYVPNGFAKSISKGKTRNIGIVLSDRHSSLDKSILSATIEETLKSGYIPFVVSNAAGQPLEELANENMPCALVLLGTFTKSEKEGLGKLSVPLVQINEYSGSGNLIQYDGYDKTFGICSRLLELGHRRIALVCDHHDNSWPFLKKGFLSAIESYGVNERHCPLLEFSNLDDVPAQIKTVMRNILPPTAMIVPDRQTADAVITQLRKSRLGCPKNVSLCVLDGVYEDFLGVFRYGGYYYQPESIAGLCLKIIKDAIEGNSISSNDIYLVQGHFEEGDSIGIPPTEK